METFSVTRDSGPWEKRWLENEAGLGTVTEDLGWLSTWQTRIRKGARTAGSGPEHPMARENVVKRREAGLAA